MGQVNQLETEKHYLQRNLKYIHDLLVWSFNVLRYGNKKEIDISDDISEASYIPSLTKPEPPSKDFKWKNEHENILIEWADKAMCYRWLRHRHVCGMYCTAVLGTKKPEKRPRLQAYILLRSVNV